jgi:hypothetical protein
MYGWPLSLRALSTKASNEKGAPAANFKPDWANAEPLNPIVATAAAAETRNLRRSIITIVEDSGIRLCRRDP